MVAMSTQSEKNPVLCGNLPNNHICLGSTVSNLSNQTWERDGNLYNIYLSNQNNISSNEPEIVVWFAVYDGTSNSFPQPGMYNPVHEINTTTSEKQFMMLIYLNGEDDYMVDLNEISTFEITSIKSGTIKGRGECKLHDYFNKSDKKEMHFNFDNAIYQ